MVGAFHAAVEDCEVALQNVSPPTPVVLFPNDCGLLLKVKLHTRMARQAGGP
jgi:hypothetical protein